MLTMAVDNAENEPGSYLLSRNYMSSCRHVENDIHSDSADDSRLTGQHNFMTWRNGWLLHPTLKEKMIGQAEQRIADVGTGNG